LADSYDGVMVRRLAPYVIAVVMGVAAQVTVSVAGLTGPATHGIYAGFCAAALLMIAAVAIATSWPSRQRRR